MKKLIFILISIFGLGFNSNSQTTDNSKTERIIVLVNHASWCPVCVENGPRVKQNVFTKYMTNNKFKFVINDLSNEESKVKSREIITDSGVNEISKTLTSTGMIYFINPTTKTIITSISVSKSNDEILKTFEEVLNNI